MLHQITAYGAGKTIEAFKANTYSDTSDAEEMINGIKNKVSGYSSTFKSTNITSTDFYRKSKAIKYWASHGSNSGTVWGTNCPSISLSNGFKWSGSNLEFVFLAACNQLDGANTNPRAKYANSMVGANAVRVICGYHEGAPGSGKNKDALVARYFIDKAKTGESVKSSWIQANQLYGNQNYCVLTHSGSVQYSRFEGFPGATYARPGASSTSILRFSAAKPNGTAQPYTSKNMVSDFQTSFIPTYRIQAKKRDIAVYKDIDTVVQKSGDFVTTLNGEIGENALDISAENAMRKANDWLQDAYKGISLDDFEDADISITPIVKAEVNLLGVAEDEIEETVAYDVTITSKFNGIPIVGDKYCAIVDSTGVISSAVNHNDYEIIPVISSEQRMASAKEILSCMKIAENHVKSVSNIEFRDDDGDGIYDPSYTVTLNGGKDLAVNLVTNTVSEL